MFELTDCKIRNTDLGSIGKLSFGSAADTDSRGETRGPLSQAENEWPFLNLRVARFEKFWVWQKYDSTLAPLFL
jgi:hypothetical protein